MRIHRKPALSLILPLLILVILASGSFLISQLSARPHKGNSPPSGSTSPPPQAHSDWNTYTNSYFGYEIRYPDPMTVMPSLGDAYGTQNDEEFAKAQPTVEVGQSMMIEVFYNSPYLSPHQWVAQSIDNQPGNTIKNESESSIQGRDAYAVEFLGVFSFKYNNRLRNGHMLSQEGSTADRYYRYEFVADGDKIIVISYQTSPCPRCDATFPLYPDVASSFRFLR